MRRAHVLTALSAAASIAVACRHRAPEIAAPPAIPEQQLAPLPTISSAPTTAAALVPDTAKEMHVDIDTHGGLVDVRYLLDYVARQGGFTLVYSPKIDKKIRVALNDVPVSVALETLLRLADLTIETATPDTKPPGSTSVVFYQVPVNIDSLSVEAIMKRFGVGRTMAELIVRARTTKP